VTTLLWFSFISGSDCLLSRRVNTLRGILLSLQSWYRDMGRCSGKYGIGCFTWESVSETHMQSDSDKIIQSAFVISEV